MLMATCFQIKRMLREARGGTSLVVQWLRLKFPRQGWQVQSLVGELPHVTGCGQKQTKIRERLEERQVPGKAHPHSPRKLM